jgi:hypothetical protein
VALRLAQEIRQWRELEPGIADSEVIFTWPDGWTARVLNDIRAVRAVGERMRNCFRTVDPALLARPGLFASMHDEHGVPRVVFFLSVRDYGAALRIDYPGRRANHPCLPEHADRFRAWNEALGLDGPVEVLMGNPNRWRWMPIDDPGVQRVWFSPEFEKFFDRLMMSEYLAFPPPSPGETLRSFAKRLMVRPDPFAAQLNLRLPSL